MHSVIHSQGGVEIGSEVVLGGGCKISGGVFQTERCSGVAGMGAREQTRWTKGPIRIGDRCLVGFGSLFLDGIEIGEGAVIGAGSVMISSVIDGLSVRLASALQPYRASSMTAAQLHHQAGHDRH